MSPAGRDHWGIQGTISWRGQVVSAIGRVGKTNRITLVLLALEAYGDGIVRH